MRFNIYCIFVVKSYSITKETVNIRLFTISRKSTFKNYKNPPMTFLKTSHFAEFNNFSGKYIHTNSLILIKDRGTQ